MYANPNLPFPHGLVPQGGDPVPFRRDDVVRYAAGRESFLFDRQADAVHVLNLTALAVWELCDGVHSPDQIADYLTSHFSGVPAGAAGTVVRSALATFEEKGLIRWLSTDEEEQNG